MDDKQAEGVEGYSKLMGLSNAVVRLYKEQLGRGPTKARADYAGPDAVVVTLENTLAPAERKLAEMGEGRRMAESRLMTMRAAEAEFCRAAEDIMGRKVRSVVCGMDAERDISTKVFYLEPAAT